MFLIALVESLSIICVNGYLAINGYGIVCLVITISGAKIITSVMSLYLLNRHAIKARFDFDVYFCRELIYTIIPFAWSNFLGIISMRANFIMLSIWSTISMVGLYAAASKVMEMVLVIPSLFAQLLLPRLAKSYAEYGKFEMPYLEKLLPWLFALTIPVGVGILVFAKPVLTFLFGEQFADADVILAILMVFCIIESADTIMAVMLRAAGYQTHDVRMFSANPITNVGLNCLLIPIWGGLGAAIAKLAGGFGSSALRYAFISKSFLAPSWLRITAMPLLVSTAMILGVYLLKGFLPPVMLGVIYVSSGLLLLYTLYKFQSKSTDEVRDRTMRLTFQGMLERLNLFDLARTLHYGFARTIQWCQYVVNIDTHIRNERFQKLGVPDGYPLPSPRMVYLVTGQYRLEFFYQNGVLAAECIKRTLEKNGLHMDAFNRVLDFGCGCGRVIRHWSPVKGPKLFGTDYNPYPIGWCQKAFPFAKFSVNYMQTPLDYKDGQFDFIYAISVFTHLPVTSQQFWINELLRVLKSGGYLYLTTMGESYLLRLTLKEQELFKAGHTVVIMDSFNGSNVCGAFHPEAYVRQVLASGFHVVDFIPNGAKDANQDAFLLQKPV